MEKEILYKFFEGAASYEEEVRVKEWIESSQENVHEFFHERKLFDAMVLLSGENMSSQLITKKSINFRPIIKEIIKIAAIVVITLAFGTLFRFNNQSNDQLSMQTISVPAGQRINIKLPDGTNVWLNARTTIKYPVSFNTKSRNIFLDGEAYFDVAKDKQKPFIVQTNKYNVEVFGTKFNIESYSDSETFETSLMEGSVSVTSIKDPQQKVLLTPDNKATLNDGQILVTPIVDYNLYRWKEGLICFKDKSLSEVMHIFEKYYGVKIVVRNKDKCNYLYTGKFRQTDGIDYALQVLNKDSSFTYERDDENQLIYIN